MFKSVYAYGNNTWQSQSALTQNVIYDSWNPVLVVRTPTGGITVRKYTWGLDMSQSIPLDTPRGVAASERGCVRGESRVHGAGGIGGLLACVETQSTTTTADDKDYWYLYDGNGNVGQILDATDHDPVTDLRIVGHYEYDPYGNVIVLDNDRRYLNGSVETTDAGYADTNPMRFSTKWLDGELAGSGVNGAVGDSGLGYWGYRYYSPRLGRWLNRDPIGETGGFNLYGFVHNTPTTRVDLDGRIIIGIGGLIPTSGRDQIQRILNRIKEQVDAWRSTQAISLSPEASRYIDGSAGIGANTLAEYAEDYRDRRFPNGRRNVCQIEGFVVFGYSDGATTIYRFFRDEAETSLSIPGGFVELSYAGYIDMVRKNFIAIPTAFPRDEDREVPLDREYALHADAFYQDYERFDLITHGWKGYHPIGQASGREIDDVNHLSIISSTELHDLLVAKAVEAYKEDVRAQVEMYQQYMATILRY